MPSTYLRSKAKNSRPYCVNVVANCSGALERDVLFYQPYLGWALYVVVRVSCVRSGSVVTSVRARELVSFFQTFAEHPFKNARKRKTSCGLPAQPAATVDRGQLSSPPPRTSSTAFPRSRWRSNCIGQPWQLPAWKMSVGFF
jgi:hypothetical protein